jgi:hypothetical protein
VLCRLVRSLRSAPLRRKTWGKRCSCNRLESGTGICDQYLQVCYCSEGKQVNTMDLIIVIFCMPTIPAMKPHGHTDEIRGWAAQSIYLAKKEIVEARMAPSGDTEGRLFH